MEATAAMATEAYGPENLRAFLEEREPGEYTELQEFYRNFSRTAESVKALADACRNPEWRWPLAEAGFLSILQSLSTAADERDISQQILRFVANCCASNNECRNFVLNDLGKLSACLKDDDLLEYTVVALNNICNDYEPAQDAALKENVNGVLATALYKQDYHPDNPSVCLGTTLLVLLVDRAASIANVEQVLTVSFLDDILALPLKCHDFEMYTELMEMVALLFLNETAQRWIAQRGSMVDILKVLEDAYARIDQRSGTTDANDSETEEELEILRKYTDDIRAALCDIAGMPEYRKEKMRGNHFTAHKLEKWLAEWNCDWKMHTAALVLGNVTQSDAIAITLVEDFELNHAVSGAIKSSKDKQVLHACAGLLRNLALPENNAMVRASVETFVAARRLILHEDHDKRLFVSGLRLLRQCIRDFGACQLLILKSPADSKFSLQTLTGFLIEHGGDTHLKAEVGRAAVMMYRTLNRSKCPTVPNLLHILNTQQQFIEAIVELTIIGTDTHLEGEGWFGLALASKLKDGALAVYRALRDLASVAKLIQRMQVKDVQTAGQDAGKTKENAKVLAATLVDMIPDELERDDLEALKGTGNGKVPVS